jgi:hypothetical protein
MKHERCYVIYADDMYAEIAEKCARSIRQFSHYPIYAYMLNSDRKIPVSDTESIRWDFEIEADRSNRYFEDGENFYINRMNKSIYSMLIQRPLVVKHALENFAETAAYVDCDSIATRYADNIFSFFKKDSQYPAFVEGIYEYLSYESRGVRGQEDPTETLEYPACVLFGVDQSVREKYRQTGYFVAGQDCVCFLEEWHEMCAHPQVLLAAWLYAPFNEETILNVLLWKRKIFDGLPYIYVNGGQKSVSEAYEIGFTGEKRHIRSWLAMPAREEELLFFHGEKNIDKMEMMIREVAER